MRRPERETAERACRGEVVIAARHTPGRQTLPMLDARTGADLAVEVDWRAAEPLRGAIGYGGSDIRRIAPMGPAASPAASLSQHRAAGPFQAD